MDVSVKAKLLLPTLETVTTTLPEIVPVGTGTTICVSLQLVGAAATPVKVTVLEPCVEPKFVPVIVTEVPVGPEVGNRLARCGAVVLAPTTKKSGGVVLVDVFGGHPVG